MPQPYIPDLGHYTALTAAIDALLMRQQVVVAAIDGRCAAGKSGLGALLAARYDAALIHMDDFFLRPEQRTPQRFAEPGGNVDYERFRKEVLEALPRAQAFAYTPFDCRRWGMGEPVQVPVSRLYIIEGVYSHHPYFGAYWDVSVFLRVSPEEQLRRIRQRNGDELLQRFVQEWIPMEERYFRHFGIAQAAQLCFDTDHF